MSVARLKTVPGWIRIFFLLPLLLALAPPTRAQAPPREEAFVYGINASIPGAVIGTFAPPSVERIYLLTGQTSILSPRRTEVYFWALTNEFRAAWSSVNAQVEGTLEVMQDGELVATAAQKMYTIHFSTTGERGPRPQLYVGEEAVAANARFESAQAAYQEAATQYRIAREAWLAEAREARASGSDPSRAGPAPQPPAPFNLFSTGLNQGYPVDLPPGTYEIRVRQPGGGVLAESVRELVVFQPRRAGVGYEVIPEARWTFPEQLNAPSDLLLGEADSVVYLKPHVVREYPALAYEQLQDPQYAGDVSGSEWLWVSGEPLEEGLLEIVQDGQVRERIPRLPYFVKQVPGRELGYEILVYDPSTPDVTPRVDFEAYRLPLSASQSRYTVRLVTAEEDIFVGSAREVRVVQSAPLWVLLLVPLIPLALGAAVLSWRRRNASQLQASR